MDDISRREKKRITSKGVRALRTQPGWDPANYRSSDPQDALQSLAAAGAQHRAYADASDCSMCQAERQRTKDDTALCEVHLLEALGL